MKKFLGVILVCLVLCSCSRVFVIKITEYYGKEESSTILLEYVYDGHAQCVELPDREAVFTFLKWLNKGASISGNMEIK